MKNTIQKGNFLIVSELEAFKVLTSGRKTELGRFSTVQEAREYINRTISNEDSTQSKKMVKTAKK